MIGSFKQYLVEEEKTVYFSFGRMNPPTTGHEKLLDKLAASAGKNTYRMYLSQSTDPKKNPLAYKDKVSFARKMFPRHARNILLTKNIKNVFDIAVSLYDDGFRKVVMVVGSDRVNEFNALLNKYNGEKARHGFYNFMDIKIISAGDRDPDAEGVEGMSASKMRAAAAENDFTSFSQGLPRKFSNVDSKSVFNAVRKGMGLKEEKNFKRHVELAPVSDIRESYVDGNLFEVGDQVIIKESGEVCTVKQLCSNYVIVESKTNRYRKWLDSVERVESPALAFQEKSMYTKTPDWGTPESTKVAKKKTPGETSEAKAPQDSDIKDRKGTQPKDYYKGLDKSTKTKRDAHFKKHGKKADDDKSAYKPAPGDAKAKTKTSKWTKSFKSMYGEDLSHVDVAKTRIDREKKADAVRHDRMMDRARTRQTKIKNRETKPND
jgi:hypothetical protein